MHWVEAHLRRIKNGTEVSIEKYLRGITEFNMGALNFTITSPFKQSTSHTVTVN
jgi:hypothetical protein